MAVFKGLNNAVRKLTVEEPNKWAKRVTRIAGEETVKKSPVDTGNFRGNWRGAVGSPDSTVKEAIQNHDGAQAVSLGTPLTSLEKQNLLPAQQIEIGKSAYITNAVKYAKGLNAGASKQAVNGVLVPAATSTVAKVRRGVK